MVVDRVTRENALNTKSGGRFHDPQEDQNLKKRPNSLQMENKWPEKWETNHGSECTSQKTGRFH